MKDNLKLGLEYLGNFEGNLLDPNIALAEIYSQPQYTPAPSQPLSAEDLDRFDTLSLVIPTGPIEGSFDEHSNVNWKEQLLALEASLSNGYAWLFEDVRDGEIIEQPSRQLLQSAIDLLNQQQTDQNVEEVLALFDSWTGTPMDILSPYGDFDFNHNIFEHEDTFEVNVPVSIISHKEEIIVKANIPWIKAKQFENLDDKAAAQIDLRSVLSLLPVKVNSREVKVSFENGEFRLEAPRADSNLPHAQRQNNIV
ncbi:MAG TPA: hypothetical protein PLM20_02065 [Syntrophomonadaceae bacterium]|nr:hypothetical protein [Syntrophomonadaceae bacterium]HQE22670.1 hypothetical protein [Syntrophomonadaceae bacterium]